MSFLLPSDSRIYVRLHFDWTDHRAFDFGDLQRSDQQFIADTNQIALRLQLARFLARHSRCLSHQQRPNCGKTSLHSSLGP